MEHKMVIVMRTDLGMHRGKMATQSAHAASMGILFHEDNEENRDARLTQWVMESAIIKVCLRVDSEEELAEIEQLARAAKLEVQGITDIGRTAFKGVPTRTCICIGPNIAEEVDKITGHLRLL